MRLELATLGLEGNRDDLEIGDLVTVKTIGQNEFSLIGELVT